MKAGPSPIAKTGLRIERAQAMVSTRQLGKKLRGGRRYFRNLAHWPDRIQLQFGGSSWYDLWHLHPDFHGWSTVGGGARQAHLVALFHAFRRVLNQAAAYNGPAQVFATVNSKDSPGDALYVHTPNPNAENYPCLFESYRWSDIRIPDWLGRHITKDFEVGETLFEGEVRYVVVPRGPQGRAATSSDEQMTREGMC